MTLPADTLPAIARWLANPARLERLRHHDLALTFHDEIKVAVERCRQVIDTPTGQAADVPVGPHGEGCAGTVIGHVPTAYSGEFAWSTCTGCKETWQGDPQRKLYERIRPNGDELRPNWVSVETAATMLRVTDRHVRRLVARGEIEERRISARRRLVKQSDVLMLRDSQQAGLSA